MANIRDLQAWYSAHCDGEWEHGYGVEISTLDNPGWSVEINLKGTELASRPFTPTARGMGEAEADWATCWVEEETFQGRGGAQNLDEILDTFFSWASK